VHHLQGGGYSTGSEVRAPSCRVLRNIQSIVMVLTRGTLCLQGGDSVPDPEVYLFDKDAEPKERIRFFFEVDFTDKEVVHTFPLNCECALE